MCRSMLHTADGMITPPPYDLTIVRAEHRSFEIQLVISLFLTRRQRHITTAVRAAEPSLCL